MGIMASLAVLTGRQTQVADTETVIVNTAPAGALTLFVAGLVALRGGPDKDEKLRAINDLRIQRMMAFLLGEITEWTTTGEALVIPYQYNRKKGHSRYGIPQMVGVHQSPFPFGDAIHSGAERVTVAIRALPKDDTPWRDVLKAAKSGANRSTQAFLSELLAFYGSEPGVFYRAVISGGAGNVLSCNNRRAANALARAAKVYEPVELEGVRIDQILHGNRGYYARVTTSRVLLECVEEREDHYRVGDNLHAIWSIVLENGGQLAALLGLPVDKVIQVENVNDRVYWVRAQVTAAGAKPAELDQVEATLRMICKEVDRLHIWEPFGASMMEALMASLPGSPQGLRAPVFSIPDNEFRVMAGDGSSPGFFELVGTVPNEATQGKSGNVAFGRAISPNQLDQHTLTFSTEEYPVAAVVGESKAGKSLLAWIMATQAAGRNIVFVHHSSTEEEFAGKLARLWDGTYLNVDLPIVHTEEEFRAAVAVIKEGIAAKFKRWEAEWTLAGHPIHLPLVIRVSSGTEALAVFYKRYVRGEIIRLLSKFYKRGWRFSLVDDDLADLPDPNVRDHDLGMTPANEGSALRHDITASVNKIRKVGCVLYFLTIQNQLHFEAYGPGMFKSIPLAFLISPGSHTVGAIVRPKEMPPEMEGFSFEEAARAVIDGKGVTLPSWLIEPKLFNPWLPESIRQQMGIK